MSRSSPTTLVNSDRVYLGRSDAEFSWNTLPARSFIITLLYAVQQSVILFARFEARASNDSFALRGVRSSLMKILSVRRSALCDFSLVRARNTSSRTRSLRKRTMMARVRGRPSLSARRPRRWLRSRSSISSGGDISSSVLTISNTLASVSSPWSLSRIPSNRRFGRRVLFERVVRISQVAHFPLQVGDLCVFFLDEMRQPFDSCGERVYAPGQLHRKQGLFQGTRTC